MEHKKEILNKIVALLLKKQGEWRNLKIDDSSANVIFIDLELLSYKLNIEIKSSGKIIFSFDDGWLYFTGNPYDKEFIDPEPAIEYLNEVFSWKQKKGFKVKYKGQEYDGDITLVSVDPHRQMGEEKIYEISITTEDGEELVVGGISEYPIGGFSEYERDPDADYSEEEALNVIRDNDNNNIDL